MNTIQPHPNQSCLGVMGGKWHGFVYGVAIIRAVLITP
jgi:hypothetical protein